MSKSQGAAEKSLPSSPPSPSKRDSPTSSSTNSQAKKAKQKATGIDPRNENPTSQSGSSTIEDSLPSTPRKPLPTLEEMMAWDQYKTSIVTDADGTQKVNIQCSRLSAMGSRYPCTMLGACVCGSFRRSCKVAPKHMQQMLETSRGR